MRLGVLDVGSNTVHLLVVDAHRGGHPVPMASDKTELRLAELLHPDGSLGPDGTDRLVAAVQQAQGVAEQAGVEDLLAFATSAVRDATDGEDVLAAVTRRTGVTLEVLSGGDEARLTFLAARRWYGWSAGRLVVLDIGGGSLEMAAGVDEEPEVALSVPLGAGRLTREQLVGDPPTPRSVARLERYVRDVLEAPAGRVAAVGRPDRAVASSKTFRSLARVAGAAPSSAGPLVRRRLALADLHRVAARLGSLPAEEVAALPGVSPRRAHQLVAGAVVATAAMEALGLDAVDVCPWALREGIILRRLDWLAESG